MHFVHRPFQKNDCIAAIATPSGEGAIAIIRISGADVFDLGEKIFSGPVKNFQSHTAHYGKILASDQSVLDHVLLLVMKAPRSYTGEDTIEICCHGGTAITRRVLERIYEAGGRPAQPGEFSLRAFLNGKMDLAQAEAVQQLIAAKGELALQAAEKQLEGALSKQITAFQKEITEIAAILEAWVDFPEEGLEFTSMEEMISNLERICQKMEKLQASFHNGKSLKEGFSLCLLGSPNVGKSSLMNALLGEDRAIVTDIAGTTRDLLEEDLRIGQLHFRLTDTAGIRNTNEIVEKEGIRRSKKAMEKADLILLLLDASRPLSSDDQELIQSVPKDKTIVVWNKIDLALPSIQMESVQISAKEKIGIDTLISAIEKLVWKGQLPSKEEIIITHYRHHQALSRAIDSCHSVIKGLKDGLSPEFISSDMRASLSELGTIVGVNVGEEILSAIFSKFCLGK